VARPRGQRPRTSLDRFFQSRISTAAPRTLERYARLLSPKQALEPVPGWWFGIPATRDDLGTFARRLIWERYRDEKLESHLAVKWCNGLRLYLRLGNGVSYSVFVGGAYEPNELTFLSKTLAPGMTVVDVGANEGLFSLLSASCVGGAGRVIAVEPSFREFEWLQANIGLNRLGNIEPVRQALYSQAGSAWLTLAEFGHEGLNTIGDRIANPAVSEAGREIVELETLDALVEARRVGRLDLIKLDAEGSEVRILEGGLATLCRFHPILLIEVEADHLAAQGSSVEGLLELLADLNYRVWVFDDDGLPRLHVGDEPLSSNIVAASDHPRRSSFRPR